MSHLWGIDLGGTKIEGAILDVAALNRPLCRVRVPTESDQGYEHIRKQIGRLVKTLAAESGLPLPTKIGMGTPGVVDPHTGTLKNSNTQCLNGARLRDDLEADLGLAVVTANDANCFALAEATLGCAKGFPTVFGVILGTGVGGGLVVDGRVLNGCHGIAGEWGQLTLDANGPVSNYGTRGTVEAFIAGPALERFYAERTGQPRPLKEIVARVAEDADAQATIERLTTTFAGPSAPSSTSSTRTPLSSAAASATSTPSTPRRRGARSPRPSSIRASRRRCSSPPSATAPASSARPCSWRGEPVAAVDDRR